MMCASTCSLPIESYIWFTFSALLPTSFLSSPCPIPDKTLISGENSGGNHWNKIASNTSFFWLIPWGLSSGLQLKNEGWVSKEIVVARRWEVKHESLHGSNFHRKEITKLTFRVLALRRQFPIRLRRWRFKRSSCVVTFRLDYEGDVSSALHSSDRNGEGLMPLEMPAQFVIFLRVKIWPLINLCWYQVN